MKPAGPLWTAGALMIAASVAAWDPANQLREGYGGQKAGQYAQAGSAAQANLDQRDRREAAYRQNNLGVAHLERYDYAAAAAAFAQAAKIDPGLTIARLNHAIAELYNGNLDASAASARAAVDASPQSPHAHYVSGLIARAANRSADARAAFQRVLDLDPDDVGSRVQLGQIHLMERQFAEAAATFEAALTREPFNATAAYGLATTLVRAGQREAGEAAMARFQTLRDNPAAITYSATYLEQGRYGEAVASTGLEPDLIDASVPDVSFVDATREMFGVDDPRGVPAVFDADRDGDLDVLLGASDGLALLTNDAGRLARRRIIDAEMRSATAAVAGDYDNDGRADLLVLGNAGDSLYRQEAGGALRRTAVDFGVRDTQTPARAAAFVDLDHDADLDIVLSSPNRALRNNGNGTFSDITSAAGLTGTAPIVAIIPTDYDNRRDIDLLLIASKGAPALFANRRDGTFADTAVRAGLPAGGAYTAAATGDINKDGAPDFVLASPDAPATIATSRSGGTFGIAVAPAETAGATAVQLFDYDSDGILDLMALTPNGPRLWRHGPSRAGPAQRRAGPAQRRAGPAQRRAGPAQSRAGLAPQDPPPYVDVTSTTLPASLSIAGDRPIAMNVGDIDVDRDHDVLIRFQSGRVRFWRNARPPGDRATASLRVRLDARVSNRDAAGAKVEMQAGSLRHRFESSAATPPAAPADIVFGLGARARADVVRVLWPSGILQAETDPARDLTVVELDRKPSSCPFLFSWNGRRFEFVTDFMGGGEMGAWLAPGIRNVPDPDEYVRLRDDQLAVKDGRYELRITNELEEALFFDRLQLVSVMHPRGVDAYPNEGLRSPSERRPFTVHTTRDERLPVAATDHHGHDVLDRLRAIDRRYVDDFRLEPIQGYAEPHWVTLDLGVLPANAPLRLLLTGWTDYAFSSDNLAAHQAGLPSDVPSLDMKIDTGPWQAIVSEVGLPVGRPQTVVVDLSPHAPPRGGRVQVRVKTSLRVYWDQALVDTSLPAERSIARLDPSEAQLRWRGFSAEIRPDARGPLTYDYDRVSPDNPWKTLAGRYTREGNVRPLLTATDDLFVVSAPGDEIALIFDASQLPAPRAGWMRTFFLYADGFSKEMNLHSASPDQLEPLPFHAMTAYPYRAPERYPSTPAHNRYRAEYNTRVIGGPLPPLLFAGKGDGNLFRGIRPEKVPVPFSAPQR